jgi:6-phosphogluconolactonase
VPSEPSPPEIFIGSAATLADEFARRVALEARVAVADRRRFALALPGGSIARAFLPVLAVAPLPWESMALFWVDERAVSSDDPESNVGSARLLFAGSPAVDSAHWYPMKTGASLEVSAQAYARQLVSALGNPPVLDVALLGVGEDGHVASLFPGREPPEAAWVAAEPNAPKPPRERVTMTYGTLAAASVVCIAAIGASKAAILHSLLVAPSPELPASRVVASARTTWVFADGEAAALLPRDRRSS